ncbi:MAG: hypothetical protein MZU97_12205 [Bacillus subtilis]|nr:hypothetical protein [Bacillus subtilis]
MIPARKRSCPSRITKPSPWAPQAVPSAPGEGPARRPGPSRSRPDSPWGRASSREPEPEVS